MALKTDYPAASCGCQGHVEPIEARAREKQLFETTGQPWFLIGQNLDHDPVKLYLVYPHGNDLI